MEAVYCLCAETDAQLFCYLQQLYISSYSSSPTVEALVKAFSV